LPLLSNLRFISTASFRAQTAQDEIRPRRPYRKGNRRVHHRPWCRLHYVRSNGSVGQEGYRLKLNNPTAGRLGDGVGTPHSIELVDQSADVELGRMDGYAEATSNLLV